jgi:hypothetical protein
MAQTDNNIAGPTDSCTLTPGGASCSANSHIIAFNRPGQAAPTDLNSTVSCSIRTCPIGQTIDETTAECK